LVKLPALKDEQIKELVCEEYEIKNSLYLERISDIAKGSPRLAVMAARLAVHENTLASIADVSNLYEQYFGSITDDLRDLRDAKLLQVAGIISFFQTVDRSNSELVGAICDAFDLTPDELWQGARRLHELEMVDMYENEIVKISDQVLSTYLFYLSAFREKAVDFGIILEHFFPRFRQRVVDALNPVLDAFDARKITDDIRPTVDRVWRLLQQRGDQDVLRQLMEVFWFAQQTKVLVYVKEEIHRLPIDPQPVESTQFSASPDKEAPWLVGILSLFRYGEEVSFSRLFLAVAEPLLHTHFQTNEMKGESLVLTRFDVPVSPALFEFRRTLWQRVFSLGSLPSLRDSVLNLIKNHSHAGYEVANAEILAKDAPSVLSFFRSNLDPSDHRHCVIVHDYLELLTFRGVAGDEALASLFIG